MADDDTSDDAGTSSTNSASTPARGNGRRRPRVGGTGSQITRGSQVGAAIPEWYWLVVFTVIMLGALAIAALIPRQTPAQQFYFRVPIAVAAAGIASIIPGFFEIQLKWFRNVVRAGGAIGILVFFFVYNPPAFEPDDLVDIAIDGDWEFFLVADSQEIKGGSASIRHNKGSRVFFIRGDVPANPKAKERLPPLITFESNFGVITSQRVAFHYRNNSDEEGVASADYADVTTDELLFNFHDYADTDKDTFRSGLLRFRRVKK